MMKFLTRAIPRTIVAADTRLPLIILTDASLEGNDKVSGLGAVCIDRADGAKLFYAELFEPAQLSKLQKETNKVINGLEVLAVKAAIFMWKERRLHRRCFIFIDDDAAGSCLMNSSSHALSIQLATHEINLLQASHPFYVWWSRVPSSSNLSDLASRMDVLPLLNKGYVRVRVQVQV
jgi:hypothetical protein